MKKTIITLPGGRPKVQRHRFSGDHDSMDNGPDYRRIVLERHLDREVREAVVPHDDESNVVADCDPIMPAAVVVSCGLARDDDTANCGDRHIFIAIDEP
ncbi:hypothetical protein KKB10_04985 [Patescibacteria group bacterium]|nr:hypothetical protein [Patescibacteria group bacterium]MBU1075125.1 hypothetical protein [Patescibacteria group bacterium]MBU2228888.1 hypothetical protein [Patescibacteria group bacterium]MBU2235477.1 hypothetical protein [Patescibacteria group bacterium]